MKTHHDIRHIPAELEKLQVLATQHNAWWVLSALGKVRTRIQKHLDTHLDARGNYLTSYKARTRKQR